jgi:hypothetical protein
MERKFSEHITVAKQNVHVLLFDIRINGISIIPSTKQGRVT